MIYYEHLKSRVISDESGAWWMRTAPNDPQHVDHRNVKLRSINNLKATRSIMRNRSHICGPLFIMKHFNQ